jgi:hypothetical protein
MEVGTKVRIVNCPMEGDEGVIDKLYPNSPDDFGVVFVGDKNCYLFHRNELEPLEESAA